MKCPNCYNEIEPGSSKCKYCGIDLYEEFNIQPKVEDTVEEKQPEKVEEVVEPQVEEIKVKPKKKIRLKINFKKIAIIMIVILILGGIIGGAIYFYLKLTSPETVYKKAITNVLDKVFNAEVLNATSFDATTKLSIETDELGQYYSYNGVNFDSEIGLDLEEKKAVLNAKLNKGEQDYLDIEAYSDFKKGKLYVSDEEIYDGVISLDIPENIVVKVNDILSSVINSQTQKSLLLSQLNLEINDIISNNINLGTFSKSGATIIYDGENKRITDNTLTLTEGQYKKFAINVLEELGTNETFLSALGDYKDYVINLFEEMLDELQYLEDDENVETPNKIKIHLYTSGFEYEFFGIKVEYIPKDQTTETQVQLLKSSKDVYDISYVIVGEKSINQGSFNVNVDSYENGQKEVTVTFDYNESSFKVVLDYSCSLNNGISSTIDLIEVKEYSEMTDEENTEIMSKIEGAQVYVVIEAMIDYMQDRGIDFGLENKTILPSNIKIEASQNYTITDEKNVAVYEEPSTFELEYDGNLYKVYRKNNRIGDKAQLYINLLDGEPKEIIDGYVEQYNYVYDTEDIIEKNKKGEEIVVGQKNKYDDASISDVTEETINGILYYKVSIKYTSGTTKNNITFYATQLSNKYSYVVKIEDVSEIISDAEKEKILSITIY